jgi:hypothetical protein
MSFGPQTGMCSSLDKPERGAWETVFFDGAADQRRKRGALGVGEINRRQGSAGFSRARSRLDLASAGLMILSSIVSISWSTDQYDWVFVPSS